MNDKDRHGGVSSSFATSESDASGLYRFIWATSTRVARRASTTTALFFHNDPHTANHTTMGVPHAHGCSKPHFKCSKSPSASLLAHGLALGGGCGGRVGESERFTVAAKRSRAAAYSISLRRDRSQQ
jgi:hypothetical protein